MYDKHIYTSINLKSQKRPAISDLRISTSTQGLVSLPYALTKEITSWLFEEHLVMRHGSEVVETNYNDPGWSDENTPPENFSGCIYMSLAVRRLSDGRNYVIINFDLEEDDLPRYHANRIKMRRNSKGAIQVNNKALAEYLSAVTGEKCKSLKLEHCYSDDISCDSVSRISFAITDSLTYPTLGAGANER